MASRPFISRTGLALTMALALVAAVGYFVVFRVTTRGGGAAANGSAADFTLPDQLGGTASLAALVARGPAVLFFYRGHW